MLQSLDFQIKSAARMTLNVLFKTDLYEEFSVCSNEEGKTHKITTASFSFTLSSPVEPFALES